MIIYMAVSHLGYVWYHVEAYHMEPIYRNTYSELKPKMVGWFTAEVM